LVVILFVFYNTLTFAQTVDSSAIRDSFSIKNIDTNAIKSTKVKFKDNDLKSEVKFKAYDSIVYDAASKTLVLFNQGQVNYDDIELKSDSINYNIDSSLLSASKTDTSSAEDTVAHQIFKQGDQTFTFTELQYNFKSERALVESAFTQYNEGYIHSEQIKRNKDQSIYGINNVYTTCNLDEPHFGIHAKKIKIIPDVVAISGPANLEIEGIPTPLVLPFGIYPMKKGQSAGFIFPKTRFEQNRGFGITNGGYYFPINERMDLIINADIYTNGSWTSAASTNYRKRYKYNGSFGLSYSSIKLLSSENFNANVEQTFNVRWSHTTDAKALNGATFGASVNFGSRNNNRFNFDNNLNNYLNNDINSSITFSKSWPGKPYNLIASARHNQNNNTGLYTFKLPEINFNVNSIQPLQRKNTVGKERWYEKIRFNYNATAINELQFYDTLLRKQGLNNKNFTNGIEHRTGLSANYKLLKYITLSVNANYNEYWYTRKSFKYFNADDRKIDTITNTGFFTARNWNTSATMNTTIFGMKHFKRGPIRGIRHTLTPSINFSYNPDFGSGIYNYSYYTFLDSTYRQSRLSYFEESIIGRPPAGKNGTVGFNLSQILQAKVRSKKDTVNGFKKINLLDNLSANMSYNIAVDSFKWSDLSINYSTLLLSKFNISGGFAFSPYAYDTARNTRSATYLYSTEKKLFRFLRAGVNMSTSFKSLAANANSKATPQQRNAIYNNFNAYYDFNVPWDINLSTRFDVNKGFTRIAKQDTLIYDATVTMGGNVNLTPNWKIAINNVGVNVITKKITSLQLGMIRDLHCWQMSIDVVPFGYARSYNFTLGVKSSVLQDLKLARNKSFTDNF
jgi:lipopolysaccharide assembly outer membrane protein LptD (OstA)